MAILEIDQVLKIEASAAQPSLRVSLESPSVAAKVMRAPFKSRTPTPPSTPPAAGTLASGSGTPALSSEASSFK